VPIPSLTDAEPFMQSFPVALQDRPEWPTPTEALLVKREMTDTSLLVRWNGTAGFGNPPQPLD
jgi:hypothetical protein